MGLLTKNDCVHRIHIWQKKEKALLFHFLVLKLTHNQLQKSDPLDLRLRAYTSMPDSLLLVTRSVGSDDSAGCIATLLNCLCWHTIVIMYLYVRLIKNTYQSAK
jgi:hypothetical protein